MMQNQSANGASSDLSSPTPLDPASNAVDQVLRSRELHWLAWGAAVVSVTLAAVWMWASPGAALLAVIRGVDIALALFFAVEFFTRTGWQRSRLNYVKWRWFDFVAIVPLTALGPAAAPAIFWIVFACRAIRLVDRSLGDGFVQRKAIAMASVVEEEISDRVLVKMLARWERELDSANFGTAMAQALARNKDAVLERVYAEQLQEGTFAKIAYFTGLQSSIEKEERRLLAAIIEMVGSTEVDIAIRDVIASTLRRTRTQLGARDWRRKLGTPLAVDDDLAPPLVSTVAVAAGG